MLSDGTLTRTFGLTPRTVALCGGAIRAVTVGVVALVLAGLSVIYAQALGHTITLRHLQDFGTFYESAARARDGADMYGTLATSHPTGPLNLNPPHFHLLLWPLTAFPPNTAFAIWMASSAAALTASLLLVMTSLRLDRWAAASLFAVSYASPAMFATVLTGQVGAFLLLPYTLAWRAARKAQAPQSAVWLGLCASIKPLFLLFVPTYARLGLWRAAIVFIATVAATFAAGVAVFGVEAHRIWVQHLLSVTWAEHYMNASLLGTIQRILSASEWRQQPIADAPRLVAPVWIAAAGAISAATLWRVRRVPDADRQFLLVTTAAMLVSPLAWVYYLWFLIPPIAAHLASAAMKPSQARWMLLGGVVGLLTPPPLVLAALSWGDGVGTLTVGSVYTWSLVAIWCAAWSEVSAAAERGTAL